MKTEVLQEFIVLAQHLNYSVAAEKLHITQPRLSVHISELEKEIGFPLFNRGKRVELTAAGRRFLVAADHMLGELEAALADGTKLSRRTAESLSIMKPMFMELYPPVIPQALSRALNQFEEENPACDFALPNTMPGLSEYDALISGATDICYLLVLVGKGDQAEGAHRFVMPGDKGAVVAYPLREVSFTGWVGPRHPLAGKQSVRLRELAEYPVTVPGSLQISSYREAVKKLFRESELNPVFHTFFPNDRGVPVASIPLEDEVAVGFDFLDGHEEFNLSKIEIIDAPKAHIAVAHLDGSESKALRRFVDVLIDQPYENEGSEALPASLEYFSRR